MSDGSPRDDAVADGDAIRLHPRRRVDALEDRATARPDPDETDRRRTRWP